MIAWIFPGQGSQTPGMSSRLSGGAARETFRIANGVLGWDVRSLCEEGSQEDLGATEVSQPALLTMSVAVARTLQAEGSFPDAVAGHSVGEFAALVVAGAISFEDALRAVAVRANAMAEAGRERPGSMAAILGLGADRVESVCCGSVGGIVGIAAINAPQQIVISGEVSAVAAAGESARAAGARRVIVLDVSVAAHSPLMEPAGIELGHVLASTTMREPIVPFVSCVGGTVKDDAAEIAALLCDALTRPVLWVETVRALSALGADRFLEVGPGKVLTGLVRSILPDANAMPVGSDDAIARLTGRLAGERSR